MNAVAAGLVAELPDTAPTSPRPSTSASTSAQPSTSASTSAQPSTSASNFTPRSPVNPGNPQVQHLFLDPNDPNEAMNEQRRFMADMVAQMALDRAESQRAQAESQREHEELRRETDALRAMHQQVHQLHPSPLQSGAVGGSAAGTTAPYFSPNQVSSPSDQLSNPQNVRNSPHSLSYYSLPVDTEEQLAELDRNIDSPEVMYTVPRETTNLAVFCMFIFFYYSY